MSTYAFSAQEHADDATDVLPTSQYSAEQVFSEFVQRAQQLGRTDGASVKEAERYLQRLRSYYPQETFGVAVQVLLRSPDGKQVEDAFAAQTVLWLCRRYSLSALVGPAADAARTFIPLLQLQYKHWLLGASHPTSRQLFLGFSAAIAQQLFEIVEQQGAGNDALIVLTHLKSTTVTMVESSFRMYDILPVLVQLPDIAASKEVMHQRHNARDPARLLRAMADEIVSGFILHIVQSCLQPADGSIVQVADLQIGLLAAQEWLVFLRQRRDAENGLTALLQWLQSNLLDIAGEIVLRSASTNLIIDEQQIELMEASSGTLHAFCGLLTSSDCDSGEETIAVEALSHQENIPAVPMTEKVLSGLAHVLTDTRAAMSGIISQLMDHCDALIVAPQQASAELEMWCSQREYQISLLKQVVQCSTDCANCLLSLIPPTEKELQHVWVAFCDAFSGFLRDQQMQSAHIHRLNAYLAAGIHYCNLSAQQLIAQLLDYRCTTVQYSAQFWHRLSICVYSNGDGNPSPASLFGDSIQSAVTAAVLATTLPSHPSALSEEQILELQSLQSREDMEDYRLFVRELLRDLVVVIEPLKQWLVDEATRSLLLYSDNVCKKAAVLPAADDVFNIADAMCDDWPMAEALMHAVAAVAKNIFRSLNPDRCAELMRSCCQLLDAATTIVCVASRVLMRMVSVVIAELLPQILDIFGSWPSTVAEHSQLADEQYLDALCDRCMTALVSTLQHREYALLPKDESTKQGIVATVQESDRMFIAGLPSKCSVLDERQRDALLRRINLLALVGIFTTPFRIKQDHIGAVGIMKVLSALRPRHYSRLLLVRQAFDAGRIHRILHELQHIWRRPDTMPSMCSAITHRLLRNDVASAGAVQLDASAQLVYLTEYCIAYFSFYQKFPQSERDLSSKSFNLVYHATIGLALSASNEPPPLLQLIVPLQLTALRHIAVRQSAVTDEQQVYFESSASRLFENYNMAAMVESRNYFLANAEIIAAHCCLTQVINMLSVLYSQLLERGLRVYGAPAPAAGIIKLRNETAALHFTSARGFCDIVDSIIGLGTFAEVGTFSLQEFEAVVSALSVLCNGRSSSDRSIDFIFTSAALEVLGRVYDQIVHLLNGPIVGARALLLLPLEALISSTVSWDHERGVALVHRALQEVSLKGIEIIYDAAKKILTTGYSCENSDNGMDNTDNGKHRGDVCPDEDMRVHRDLFSTTSTKYARVLKVCGVEQRVIHRQRGAMASLTVSALISFWIACLNITSFSDGSARQQTALSSLGVNSVRSIVALFSSFTDAVSFSHIFQRMQLKSASRGNSTPEQFDCAISFDECVDADDYVESGSSRELNELLKSVDCCILLASAELQTQTWRQILSMLNILLGPVPVGSARVEGALSATDSLHVRCLTLPSGNQEVVYELENSGTAERILRTLAVYLLCSSGHKPSSTCYLPSTVASGGKEQILERLGYICAPPELREDVMRTWQKFYVCFGASLASALLGRVLLHPSCPCNGALRNDDKKMMLVTQLSAYALAQDWKRFKNTLKPLTRR